MKIADGRRVLPEQILLNISGPGKSCRWIREHQAAEYLGRYMTVWVPPFAHVTVTDTAIDSGDPQSTFSESTRP